MKTLFKSAGLLAILITAEFFLPALSSAAVVKSPLLQSLTNSATSTAAAVSAAPDSGLAIATDTSTGVSASTTIAVSGLFCQSLGSFSSSTLAQIATLRTTIVAEKAKQESALAAAITQKDDALAQSRVDESAAMQSVFALLDASAATAGQKTAVKEFKKAVTDATASRQKSVDDALAAYRSGLASALADAKNSFSQTLDDFNTSITANLTAAKTDCSNGKNDVLVRTSVKAALKSAKDKLAKSETSAAGVNAKIKSLLSQRRKTIVAADQDFTGALNAARNVLKQSLTGSLVTSASTTAAVE